ncbi:MAG: TolC family protein [Deltaproteobacteria bacterium]|nr:TolC family protein [Deltaproteobacteria bacterium]
MSRQRRTFFLAVFFLPFWLAPAPGGTAAESGEPALLLDLPAALEQALRENPELQAKRQALGTAQGRVQQAELLFQENPRLSVDADARHRKFSAPTGRSAADVEVRLLQEIEIAGQRGYRREAAAKNLAQAEWSVADAERLLRLEVTQAFYDLLALQEKIAAQRQVLATQEALLQAGLTRFDRGDISVLELDTLRLDRDRAQNDLMSRENEKVLAETRLRLLLGLAEPTPLTASGALSAPAIDQGKDRLLPLETLETCAFAQRPDLKVARLALETREAELRLAQARRIPNIALGPLYRLDNEDQVIGGTLVVPLPFFNRNQQEIATALANLGVSRTELAARERTIRQEVHAAYTRVQLAERRLAPYGKSYLDNLGQSAAFAQKAYEAGEITIFEFSVVLDRLVQTRFRYLDAVLAYLQATVELDARLSFSCTDRAESETGGRGK